MKKKDWFSVWSRAHVFSRSTHLRRNELTERSRACAGIYRVRLLVVLLVFFLEEENLGMADVRIIFLLWANLCMFCCAARNRK
jgi:hypothetical protein